MAAKVVLVGPFLEQFVPSLSGQVELPVEFVVTPGARDEDVCPLVSDAQIAVTSLWTKAMGSEASCLRLIQVPGAGCDKIDATAIPEGVLVANCYEHDWAIAEHILMMCLALSRRLLEADRTIRQANWRLFAGVGYPLLPELGGRTIGLIGLGRIGRAVAILASAFRMRRIGIDVEPIPDPVRESLGLSWVGTPSDLDQVLADSDFVVMAVPLNNQTRGMLGARELRLLKPGAFLINPARAELIDEKALYEALRDRAFGGAALDPWWSYPKNDECVAPSRFPFADLDNVIMTPHMAGNTIETFARRMCVVAANINRFFRGEPLVNIVKELSRA